MSTPIAIELEFLSGVSYASSPASRAHAEWPPQPDRLFQALVAAWGRNTPEAGDEQAALEWLEARDYESLRIYSPPAEARDVPLVFVPPNDVHVTTATAMDGLRVIPELRKNRQPRYFPARIPHGGRAGATIHYVWRDSEGIDEHDAALERLAREVTYVGNSASLVRARFLRDASTIGEQEGWLSSRRDATLRVPYRGRLAELRRRYAAGMPSTPSTVIVTRQAPALSAAPTGAFDDRDAIVLAHRDGFRPSLDAFPIVAKRMRDALLAAAKATGLSIPEILSGHRADGAVSERDHLAIVPLANVGFSHADGTLMGVGLIWPRAADADERTAALAIVRAFVRSTDGNVGMLHFGRDGSWRVQVDATFEKRSLDIVRYAQLSRRWVSVLPVVLDRHPKDRDDRALDVVVAQMFARAGLPPSTLAAADLQISQASSLMGAPDVWTVHRAMPKDSPYLRKRFVHLDVTFATEVRGPLLVGSGRHRGLGLMLPMPQPNERANA